MKYKFLTLFFLLYFSNIFAQTSDDKIIYLDSLHNPSTKTNYTYKRIVKDHYADQDLYEVDNEDMYEKGKFRNGNKNGEWTGRDKKYNFTYTENYADGKLTSGTSIDSNKIKHHYTLVYEGFGSDKKMHKLFDDISGELFTQKFDLATIIVNVDKEGKLSSIQTTPDISNKLGKIIKKYKHKTPIVYRGIAIPYAFPLTWTHSL